MPEADAYLSRSLAEVEAFLIPIAKAMTVAEVDQIARLDGGGMDWQKHKTALQGVLARADVSYPKDDRTWYPAEVVEAAAHIMGAAGRAPAMAIVLLDAIRNGDDRANTEFYYATQSHKLWALPSEARRALMAGFRYMYESEPWTPVPPPRPPLGRPAALDWAV